MATPTDYKSIADWNSYIDGKVAALEAQGKTVYKSVDENGASHYSVYGQQQANNVANSYSSNSVYQDKSGNLYANTTTNGYTSDQLTDAVNTAVSNATAQYQSIIENLQNQNSTTTTNANATDYQDIYEQYEKLLQQGSDEAAAAYKSALESSKASTNDYYDEAQRNNYKNYKLSTKALPEQLSALGMTGGASESSQLGLLNNYGENVRTTENERASALASQDADYNEKIASNSIDTAKELASTLLGLQTDNVAYQRELAAQEAEEATATAEATAEAERTAYLVSTNNSAHIAEAAAQAEGYNTTHWTDENGVYQWEKTTKKSSGTGTGTTNTTKNNTSSSSTSDDTVVNTSNTTKSTTTKNTSGENEYNTVSSTSADTYSSIFKAIQSAKTLTALNTASVSLTASSKILTTAQKAILNNMITIKKRALS